MMDRALLQNVSAEKNRYEVPQDRADETDKNQAYARLLQAGKKTWSCGQADHTDEHAQTDGIEHPHCRFGYTSECREHRTEPTKDKTHDQRSAARRKRNWQPGNGHRQKTDKPADKNAGADKNHVGGAAGPVRITEDGNGAIDISFGADQAKHVTSVELSRPGDRDLFSCACYPAQKDAPKLASPRFRFH